MTISIEKTGQLIYIIGAGAIGKALAVYLKGAGRNVLLIRGTIDNGSVQTENLNIKEGAGYSADVEIATLSTLNTINGIVVLATKSYGNAHLAALLKEKTGSSPIVLCQNGLGIELPFLELGFPEVYRCVLYVTSEPAGNNAVRFKSVSSSPIGIERGNSDTLETIVKELDTPHFKFRAEDQIQKVIWKKAIVNSVFNSLCALLETDNGIFSRDIQILNIAKRVIQECVCIAECKGIFLSAEEVEESVLQISKASSGQLISTLQDIRKGRPTEIATLNLEIAAIAEKLGKEDIIRETKLLGQLVRIKENFKIKGNKSKRTEAL